MQLSILTFIYLIASVTFIIGLKMLSHPETARRGNAVAASGMTLAIFGTIFLYQDENGNVLHNHLWIFAGLIIGGIIGLLAARRVKMTSMPEMVSLFNGMGGACAALISIIEFNHFASTNYTLRIYEAYDAGTAADVGFLEIPVRSGTMITIFLGLIIGSVSFAGSIVAWGKLAGKIKDYAFRGQHIVNMILLIAALIVSAFLIYKTTQFALAESYDGATSFALSNSAIHTLFYTVFLLALVYGILFVLPIGGADMP